MAPSVRETREERGVTASCATRKGRPALRRTKNNVHARCDLPAHVKQTKAPKLHNVMASMARNGGEASPHTTANCRWDAARTGCCRGISAACSSDPAASGLTRAFEINAYLGGIVRRQHRNPPQMGEPEALTVDEFCAKHGGISKALFYKLVRAGSGPRIMKLGRRTLISRDAAAEWRKEMEQRTAEAINFRRDCPRIVPVAPKVTGKSYAQP